MSSLLGEFLRWERETPDRIMFRQPSGRTWKTWTYQQAGNDIRRIAAGLNSLQLPLRSRIAILSKNCPHWIMADLAIMMSGHISVPLYPTLTPHSIKSVLDHSEASAIIIGKLDDFGSQAAGLPSHIVPIGIEVYGQRELFGWDAWLASMQPVTEPAQWDQDEVMTIIYTSGTTGGPKGVMHSAKAFDAVVSVATVDLKLPLHPSLFSYLPLSHIAERLGIEGFGIYRGAEFSFAESLELFPVNLADTQPHIFFAVPRIWGKFREKILEKIPQRTLNILLSIPIVNALLKRSLRKKLGLSRASHIYSGAAPISSELLIWFQTLGITIFQAIGMTEDCVYSHFNRHGANRIGTVGQPLTGVKVKIADDGELRLKCPSITKGYYKDPLLTAQAFDEEGFFKTGDKVQIDADGFLTVTGRIKDLFKTNKGKYVAPTPIEMKLLGNPDIEQVCVVGMGIPQPIALITLSAAGKNKPRETLTQSLGQAIAGLNPSLEEYEQLEKAVVLRTGWSIENGLMTPTMKVKRNEVERIHVSNYPKWYDRPGVVVWEED